MKGYVQVYTGDGKGKTTAAIGLAVRAIGAGLKVFIGQFVKGMHYSELNALKRLYPDIVIRQYGRRCFIERKPSEEDISAASQGLEDIKKAVMSGDYDLVILDEANIAVYFGLIPVAEFVKLIEEKPEGVELIFTGRRAPQEILERADLVSEIKEVKHYYQKGVPAREGIEK